MPTIKERAPLSSFPDDYIAVAKLTAPNEAQQALIVQYNDALKNGYYTTCQQILIDNPDLENCRLNTTDYNTLIDEIKAIEIYFKEEVDTFIEGVAQRTIGIDDSSASGTTTYSSTKIEEMKTALQTECDENVAEAVSTLNESITALSLYVDTQDTAIGQRIDAIEAEQAKERQAYTIQVQASKWSSSYPYSQNVTLAASKTTSNPVYRLVMPNSVSQSDAEEIVEAFNLLTEIQTNNGSVTLRCYVDKPEADFSIELRGL